MLMHNRPKTKKNGNCVKVNYKKKRECHGGPYPKFRWYILITYLFPFTCILNWIRLICIVIVYLHLLPLWRNRLEVKFTQKSQKKSGGTDDRTLSDLDDSSGAPLCDGYVRSGKESMEKCIERNGESLIHSKH